MAWRGLHVRAWCVDKGGVAQVPREVSRILQCLGGNLYFIQSSEELLNVQARKRQGKILLRDM